MRSGTSWFDDDGFWAAMRPALFPEARRSRIARDVLGALGRLHALPGQRVLDLCCGLGWHALELATLGYRVTAVDRTLGYLLEARSAGRARGLSVEWIQADARAVRLEAIHDHGLLLYNSFGMFGEMPQDILLLASLFNAIRLGGGAVVETHGAEILARGIQPEESFMSAGQRWTAHHRYDPGSRSLRTEVMVESSKLLSNMNFDMKIYDAVEVEAALRAVGFQDVEILGGLDGRPYDAEAEQLVAVARKPPAA